MCKLTPFQLWESDQVYQTAYRSKALMEAVIYDSDWVQGFKSYAGHCFYGVVARSGYSFTSFGRGTVCYFLVSTCVCLCVVK